MKKFALALGISIGLLPLVSSAQQIDMEPFNAQIYNMSEDIGSFLTTRDSETLKPMGYNLGLNVNYAQSLLTVSEFNSDHVEGAINIPLDILRDEVERMFTDKNKSLLLVAVV